MVWGMAGLTDEAGKQDWGVGRSRAGEFGCKVNRKGRHYLIYTVIKVPKRTFLYGKWKWLCPTFYSHNIGFHFIAPKTERYL